MNPYQEQWDHLKSAWTQERVPQSMLFVGALDRALIDFTARYMELVFCKKRIAVEACHECADCQMVARREHPDVQWIKPEKSGGSIKIDQIRELQTYSYLTPQRATHRLIIIESADRMNTASANALLKILEEPAAHTLFVLMAQQLGTVLPTVLSRCQVLRFSSHADLATLDLEKMSEHYAQDSEQAKVIAQAESILDGLIAIIEKRTHPCVLVAQWIQFDLNTLLWFFYLVYSQIQMILINAAPASNQFGKLASLLNPHIIFNQLDKINILRRKLSHNMNVNHTLVLENLLFDL